GHLPAGEVLAVEQFDEAVVLVGGVQRERTSEDDDGGQQRPATARHGKLLCSSGTSGSLTRQIRNPKSEIRNPKHQTRQAAPPWAFRSFSVFGFRASHFPVCLVSYNRQLPLSVSIGRVDWSETVGL